MPIDAHLEQEVGRDACAFAGRGCARAEVVVAAWRRGVAGAERGGRRVVGEAARERLAARQAVVEAPQDRDLAADGAADGGVAARGAHAAGEADGVLIADGGAGAGAGVRGDDAIAVRIAVGDDRADLAGVTEAR